MAHKIEQYVRSDSRGICAYPGYVPKNLQNDMLNAGDIAVISLTANMYGLSVPSKTYFNMAAGKPLLLIADENSEVALLIKEHRLGWVVPPEEPEKLAAAMLEIMSVPEDTLCEMGRRSREVVRKYFSPEVILPEYISVLTNKDFNGLD